MGKEIKPEDKNQDFIQLYRGNLDNLVALSQNKQAFNLFMLLMKHMDGMNALTASYTVLTEILGISDSTLKRAIKYLKDNGYLCVLKSGTSNVYVINPDIAWTSYGYQKQYCKFQSNVLLSSTENHEYLNNPKAMNRYKEINPEFVKQVLSHSASTRLKRGYTPLSPSAHSPCLPPLR